MNEHASRDGRSRVVSDHASHGPLVGPRTSCALVGCAVVSMSHWLGASWLSESWIGLPVGAWLVGAGVGVSHLLESRWKSIRDTARLLAAEGRSTFLSHRSAPAEPFAATGDDAGRRARAERYRDRSDAPGTHRPVGMPASAPQTSWTDPAEHVDDMPVGEQDIPTSERGRVQETSDLEPGDCEPDIVHIAGTPPESSDAATGAKAWSMGAMRLGRRLIENPTEALRNARSILGAQAPVRSAGPARLRIGIAASAREVDSLMDIASGEPLHGSRIEWIPVETGRMHSQLMTGHRLDALVCRQRGGELVIAVPEHPSKGAGWTDWSLRMPLSYAGIFPTRVDPALVTCGGMNLLHERDARLTTRLAEACAVLGRLEPRLSVSKMWDGRAALADMTSSGGPMERVMLRLTHALAADWSDRTPARPLAALAGARAASAWLASWEQMDPKQRRGLLEVCSSIIGDEPEALFRLAAGQFAAYEDTAGLEHLSEAFRVVIASQEKVAADPLAFIHAEIELGAHGPLTLGRVAAGLCLLWATSNQQSLDYLRDDLVEDLRYSGRFVGQDQDQLLLREIIRRMDQLRTETLPMRSERAA